MSLNPVEWLYYFHIHYPLIFSVIKNCLLILTLFCMWKAFRILYWEYKDLNEEEFSKFIMSQKGDFALLYLLFVLLIALTSLMMLIAPYSSKPVKSTSSYSPSEVVALKQEKLIEDTQLLPLCINYSPKEQNANKTNHKLEYFIFVKRENLDQVNKYMKEHYKRIVTWKE